MPACSDPCLLAPAGRLLVALSHPAESGATADHERGDAGWTLEPLVPLALVTAAIVYGWGVRRLWRHAGHGRGIRRREVAAYVAGLTALATALVSPIDRLSAELFSVHMVQHELLMLVAAPLLVAGRPLVAWLWAVRRPGSASPVTQVIGTAALRQAWRWLSAPGMVWLLHAIALWTWHVPALYEAALANEGWHAVEHASFFVTALLFWWGLGHGRYGRVGYGAAVIYLFTTAMHTGLLGAALTFAPRVWYPGQVEHAAAWGLAPLEDQQLAGLIMWIPASAIFTGMALVYFASWLQESDRRMKRATIGTPDAREQASPPFSRPPHRGPE